MKEGVVRHHSDKSPAAVRKLLKCVGVLVVGKKKKEENKVKEKEKSCIA